MTPFQLSHYVICPTLVNKWPIKIPNAMADNDVPVNLFLYTSLIKDGTTQLDIKNIHPTIIDISIIFIFLCF
jgi:hypothetical protein